MSTNSRGRRKGLDVKGKDQDDEKKPKGYVVLPYIKGVSERLQRSFKKRNINLYHKAGQTLRQSLVHPKDTMQPHEQCGVVYETGCQVCGEVYVGPCRGDREITRPESRSTCGIY